jgi:methyl-accepting chemotaxis protein
MRRGAASTSRALAEQSTASEQISQEATRLAAMTAKVSRAMAEQSEAAAQISKTVDVSRKQSDQAARALLEQSRALKDMTLGAQNISKQIVLITRANREHSTAAESLSRFLTGVAAGGQTSAPHRATAAAAHANGKKAPRRKTRSTRR